MHCSLQPIYGNNRMAGTEHFQPIAFCIFCNHHEVGMHCQLDSRYWSILSFPRQISFVFLANDFVHSLAANRPRPARKKAHTLRAVRSLRNDRQSVQVKKNFIYTVLELSQHIQTVALEQQADKRLRLSALLVFIIRHKMQRRRENHEES